MLFLRCTLGLDCVNAGLACWGIEGRSNIRDNRRALQLRHNSLLSKHL